MKRTRKTARHTMRGISVLALLVLAAALAMPESAAIDTVPLPDSPRAAAASVMIGTWPTPEHPFAPWFLYLPRYFLL